MLNFYVKKGASVESPPDTVTKLYIDHARTSEYRKSPFIIQAACQGNIEIFESLLKHGCNVTDLGFAGFSRKRKNQVITNVIGAAAMNASKNILTLLLKKKSSLSIDHLANERQDFATKGVFNQEYTGYTPLMLAVVTGGQNLDCVKLLVCARANIHVVDPVGNNIFHIAAINQNLYALRFLLDAWPQDRLSQDLTNRNKKGETPYSIASDLKNQDMLKILDAKKEVIEELTKKTTEDLLKDLLEEEERKEKEKAKKKDKKKRQKLQHIAEKEGVSVDDLKARHEAENEKKRLEEE